MNSSPNKPRIAIIGGGISGLSAAQRITEQTPAADVTLYEASSRLGGIIQTTEQDGFCFEHSADSFIVNEELPWAGELCDKLGVQLISTTTEHRGALILRGATFHPIPDGLQLMTVRKLSSIITTPLLSWPGKLRVAAERFVSAKQDDREESLQQFATRRYGREMFERIIQPLVSGIYTADPQKLSVAAALPQYVKFESKYGTLAKAASASKSSIKDRGARYSLFRSPKNGMQSLIDRFEDALSQHVSLEKNASVRSLRKVEAKWEIEIAGQETTEFDAVICAMRSSAVARLLEGSSSNSATSLSTTLASIEHVGTAVVCLGFPRGQVSHALNAFGCVIPSIENRKVLAISFTNVKFPSRAPDDTVLLRVFVGGALQPEVAQLDDGELLATVKAELSELLGVSGEPLTSKIVRWPATTPQYQLGHLQRVAEIERLVDELPRLELAGNAYRGVGIPQCIRSGWRAAEKVLAELNSDCGPSDQ